MRSFDMLEIANMLRRKKFLDQLIGFGHIFHVCRIIRVVVLLQVIRENHNMSILVEKVAFQSLKGRY